MNPNGRTTPRDRRVGVFLSSTFQDMQAERDHLVTIVFPELRERLEWLDLELIDVDLRWELPEQGLDGEKINPWGYCRKSIDRVGPFFMAVLGQRYGRAPTLEEITSVGDPAAYAGMSTTELEIRHALSGAARTCFFYGRRTPVPNEVTAEIRNRYVEPGRANEVAALRALVQRSGRPVRDYDALWNGHGFVDLDSFGALVLEDLWSAVLRHPWYVERSVWTRALGDETRVERLYLDAATPIEQCDWTSIVAAAKPPPRTPHERRVAAMSAFIASRTHWFEGRDDELKKLLKYVAEPLEDDRSGVYAIFGEPGSGKSALLAKFASELDDAQAVVAHFIGAAEDSTDIRSLLEHLHHELEDLHPSWERVSPEAIETKKLAAILATRLKSCSGERRVVLILDGINHLTDLGDLGWLPTKPGEAARVVVSCTTGDSTSKEADIAARLRAIVDPSRWIDLEPLDRGAIEAVIQTYLGEYCKELDGPQFRSVCDLPQCGNPLYLMVLLTELRTVGGKGEVPVLIDELGGRFADAATLFTWVLERLEVLGEREVALWCTYLILARAGMASAELHALLERNIGPAAGASALRIERSLRRYLERRESQLDFFHSALRDAARRRYPISEPARHHAEIAAELRDRWKRGSRHALAELPWHQLHGGEWVALRDTLTDLEFMARKCAAGMTFALSRDYADAAETVPEEAITPWARFVATESYALAAHASVPGFVYQHAYNHASSGEVAAAAEQAFASPLLDDVPRIRRRNRAARSDAASERTFLGHEGIMFTLAFSPDGRFLAAGSGDDVLLRDFATSQPLAHLRGHSHWVKVCAFSHDGSLLAAGDYSGNLYVWDAQAYVLRYRRPAQGAISIGCCSFSQDDRRVLSGSWDNKLRIWDVGSGALAGEVAFETDRGTVIWCRYSQDGERFLAVSTSKGVGVWDAHTLQRLSSQQLTEVGYYGFSFPCDVSADWRLVATSMKDKSVLALFDTSTGDVVRTFTGHAGQINACAIAPDGRTIATGSDDGTVRLWHMDDGTQLASWKAHNQVSSCAFLPDGSRIVSGGWDGIVKVWDPRDVEPQTTGPRVRSCAFSPDGRRAVMGADYVSVWSTGSQTEERRIPLGAVVPACAWSPDGEWVSAAAGPWIYLLDANSGEIESVFRGHSLNVKGIAVPRDGERIVSWTWPEEIDRPGRLLTHDVTPLRVGARTVKPRSEQLVDFDVFDISVDRRRIVAGSHTTPYLSGVVEIIDLDSGARLSLFDTGRNDTHCRFSPDGASVVSVIGKGGVTVWDAWTGEPRYTFETKSFPSILAISPDGDCVVTKDSDDEGKDRRLVVRSICADATIAHVSVPETDAGTAFPDSLDYSPDGRLLAAALARNLVHVWSARDFRLLGAIRGQSFAFSPDSESLAVGDENGALTLYETHSFVQLGSLPTTEKVCAHSFSPDGTRILTFDRRLIHIWAVTARECLVALDGHQTKPLWCAFTRDSRQVISASQFVRSDGNPERGRRAEIAIWDTTAGIGVAFDRDLDGRMEVELDRGGEQVLVTNVTAPAIYLLRDGTKTNVSPYHRAASLLPDGCLLLDRLVEGATDRVVSADGRWSAEWDWLHTTAIELRDLQTMSIVHRWPVLGPIRSCRFLPDGQKLLASYERIGLLAVFDAPTGQEVLRLVTPDVVECLDVRADGQLLTGDASGRVVFWQIENAGLGAPVVTPPMQSKKEGSTAKSVALLTSQPTYLRAEDPCCVLCMEWCSETFIRLADGRLVGSVCLRDRVRGPDVEWCAASADAQPCVVCGKVVALRHIRLPHGCLCDSCAEGLDKPVPTPPVASSGIRGREELRARLLHVTRDAYRSGQVPRLAARTELTRLFDSTMRNQYVDAIFSCVARGHFEEALVAAHELEYFAFEAATLDWNAARSVQAVIRRLLGRGSPSPEQDGSEWIVDRRRRHDELAAQARAALAAGEHGRAIFLLQQQQRISFRLGFLVDWMDAAAAEGALTDGDPRRARRAGLLAARIRAVHARVTLLGNRQLLVDVQRALDARWPSLGRSLRSWEGFMFLAGEHGRKGEWAQAIDALKVARSIAPERFEILIDLALAYHVVSQYEKAVAHAREAVALDRENGTAWSVLGRCLEAFGNRAEAKEAMTEAIAKASDRAKRSDYLMTLANWYGLEGDHEEALCLYDRAIVNDPASSMAWYNAAALLESIGRNDKAEEYLRKALELDGNDYEAWYDLGRLHAKRGEAAEALQHYEKSHALKPDYYKTCLSLAMFHEDAGELPRAVEFYIKSISLTTEPELRAAIARQIIGLSGLPDTMIPSILAAADDSGLVDDLVTKAQEPNRRNSVDFPAPFGTEKPRT
ncbi:MAG TPA: tetratricopeptide repeat protein [Thermoanaerobaculia bacterium]|nr:tetratricopeptide repeat protein [Thermoanaerobaculia bacterium]